MAETIQELIAERIDEVLGGNNFSLDSFIEEAYSLVPRYNVGQAHAARLRTKIKEIDDSVGEKLFEAVPEISGIDVSELLPRGLYLVFGCDLTSTNMFFTYIKMCSGNGYDSINELIRVLDGLDRSIKDAVKNDKEYKKLDSTDREGLSTKDSSALDHHMDERVNEITTQVLKQKIGEDKKLEGLYTAFKTISDGNDSYVADEYTFYNHMVGFTCEIKKHARDINGRIMLFKDPSGGKNLDFKPDEANDFAYRFLKHIMPFHDSLHADYATRHRLSEELRAIDSTGIDLKKINLGRLDDPAYFVLAYRLAVSPEYKALGIKMVEMLRDGNCPFSSIHFPPLTDGYNFSFREAGDFNMHESAIASYARDILKAKDKSSEEDKPVVYLTMLDDKRSSVFRDELEQLCSGNVSSPTPYFIQNVYQSVSLLDQCTSIDEAVALLDYECRISDDGTYNPGDASFILKYAKGGYKAIILFSGKDFFAETEIDLPKQSP